MTHIVPVLQTLQITSWSSKKEWACVCVSSLLGGTGEFSNHACFTVNHNSWLCHNNIWVSLTMWKWDSRISLCSSRLLSTSLWSGWASQLLLHIVHDWPEKNFESINELRTLLPREVHVPRQPKQNLYISRPVFTCDGIERQEDSHVVKGTLSHHEFESSC